MAKRTSGDGEWVGGFLRWVVLFGVGGAWALSFFWHLYNAICYPEMLGDGQYILIFVMTVLVGWLLGTLVGLLVACAVSPDPAPTMRKMGKLILGGLLISPWVPMAGAQGIWLTIILPVELLTRWLR